MFLRGSDYLFHYTTLPTAIEHILPTGTFRLSPFSKMRDPRESHDWAAGGSGWGDDGFEAEFWSFNQDLPKVRDRFKVMSLTQDQERTPPDEPVFGRGFARPRLWEHYGGGHAGVCLVFQRSALISHLEQALGEKGTVRHSVVRYEDAEISWQALSFDLNDVQARGSEAVLNDMVHEHFDEFFFKKLRDWETEAEYRFVLETPASAPEYISVSVVEALRGVILGPLVAREYLPAVEALCDPHGLEIRKLRWFNGYPHVAVVAKLKPAVDENA